MGHIHVVWFGHTVRNRVITGWSIKDILQFVEGVERATVGNGGWHAERDPKSHVFLAQAIFVVGHVHVLWSRWHSLHSIVTLRSIKNLL